MAVKRTRSRSRTPAATKRRKSSTTKKTTTTRGPKRKAASSKSKSPPTRSRSASSTAKSPKSTTRTSRSRSVSKSPSTRSRSLSKSPAQRSRSVSKSPKQRSRSVSKSPKQNHRPGPASQYKELNSEVKPTKGRSKKQEESHEKEVGKHPKKGDNHYAPSTQASDYVHEEMHHLKQHKHGNIKNRKQAIAIGLSKARKAGIPVGRKKQ